ncbi:flavin-containing monooxygenase [Streptomyces sp. NPDC002851]
MPGYPHTHPELAAVVIGAGPYGLAVAAMLRRANVPVVVLERSDRVGASWAGRYDHLRLHTTRGSSKLPGLAMPWRYGPWVGRDDFVRYLERYRGHYELDVRLGSRVRRIEPAAPGPGAQGPMTQGPGARWLVRTCADVVAARAVVVATGRCHTPYLPEWPGRDAFTGTLAHAAEYRNPAAYTGRTVLVAGAGNSGTEIATALADSGAKKVWLSVRTPPNILPRSSSRWSAAGRLMDRLPIGWRDRLSLLTQRLSVPDLSPYGLPRPRVGVYSRNLREGVNPVLDHGFVAAVRSGRVRPVAAVEGFDGPEVLLADGSRLTPDAVIAATGYRPALHPLLPDLDGILTPDGYPAVHGARTHPAAPHLYFTGFTNPLNGALHQAGIEARPIAHAIRRDTATPRLPGPRIPDLDAGPLHGRNAR